MEKAGKICKGYLISLLTFGALTLVGGLLLKFTPFPENWNFYYLLAALTLVCLFIGVYMGSCFQKAGLLIGLCFSAGLLVLILLIVGACFSAVPSLSMLKSAYFLPLGAGMVGGVLGANMKK